jgi:hypothetical protein
MGAPELEARGEALCLRLALLADLGWAPQAANTRFSCGADIGLCFAYSGLLFQRTHRGLSGMGN